MRRLQVSSKKTDAELKKHPRSKRNDREPTDEQARIPKEFFSGRRRDEFIARGLHA
jgi:hypothetical protein